MNEVEGILNVRKPQIKDGNPIYKLVCECDKLDINSLYSYLLICAHFGETSAITELNDEIVGYISGYVNPNKENVLFIWQIAVKPSMRCNGIASMMINNIIEREELHNIKFIETTVTPSNKASNALFQKLAVSLKTEFEKMQFFPYDLFGKSGHEEELLLRIGPLK